MLRKRNSERGQALILIVLGFIGFLGFTALAIDGGRIYADRRYAQNRSDASSVAGAGAAAGYLKKVQDDPDSDSSGTTGTDWDCEAPAVITARDVARDQAKVNLNQNNIDPEADGNSIDVHCEDVSGNYIDVKVVVTFDSQTSFMHFVFGGVARNTVEAITRVYPRMPAAAGFAIATLDESCTAGEKGIWFAGTGNEQLYVLINGGGIFSNSCINVSGQTEDPRVEIVDGSASYYETFTYSGGNTITPTPQPVGFRIDPYIPPPSCVGDLNPPYTIEDGNRVYRPGRYTNDINVTSGHVILKPGLYCFDDGASFNVTSDLTGDGVTFYFKNDAGSFSTEGNGTVNLHAPVEPCDTSEPGYLFDDCYPAVPGLLIYFDQGNSNTIKIGGNSLSSYTGTIYARESLVMIGGTAENLSVSVQVIANSVKVHGSATINMTYDDSLIWHSPNMINLEK